VVVLNRQLPDPRIATVGIDYASGMSQLVAHLESLGHRDLLYVAGPPRSAAHHRSEEHTSELQSRFDLVCRLLLEKKNNEANTPCQLILSAFLTVLTSGKICVVASSTLIKTETLTNLFNTCCSCYNVINVRARSSP